MPINFSAFKRKIDEEEQERGSKPATLDFSSLQRPQFLAKEESSLLKNVGSAVGGKLKEFGAEQFDNIKALATGEIRLRDVINEIPSASKQVGSSVGKFAFEAVKEIVQAPLRFTANATLSAKEAITGKKQDIKLDKDLFGDAFLAQTIFQEFLGTDELKSFQTQSAQGKEIIEQLGGSSVQGDTLPLGAIMVGGILDFTGFGGSKAVTKKLVKEGAEETVEQILKKEVRGLTDDSIKAITKEIAEATDEKTVRNTIETALKNQATKPKPRKLQAPDLSKQDEILRKVELPDKDTFISKRTAKYFDDVNLKNAVDDIGERRLRARELAKQEFDLLESSVKRAKQSADTFRVGADPVASSKSALKAISRRSDETVESVLKKNTDALNILKKEVDRVNSADEFAERLLRESASDVRNAIDGADGLVKNFDTFVAGLKKREDELRNIGREFAEGTKKLTKAEQKAFQKEADQIAQALREVGQSTPSSLPKIKGSRFSDILLGDTGNLNRDELKTAYMKLYDRVKSVSTTQRQAQKTARATKQSGRVSRNRVQKSVDAVASLDEKKVKIDSKSIIPKKSNNSPVINVPPKSFLGKKMEGLKNTKSMLKFQETVQDSWIRVKRLMEKEGVKFTDDTNPYQEQQLFHGIVGAMEEDLEKRVRGIDNVIRKHIKATKADDKLFRKDINDFLYARHALERNKALGDGASGITDDVARKTLERIDGSVTAKQVKEVAEEVQKINNEVLDILLDGQVIDKKLYDTLRKKYPHHVPLNRVLPEDSADEMIDVLGSKGFNVTNTRPIRKAKGSDLPVRDIQANVIANYKQALERAQKNKVNIATYRFAKENDMLGGMFKEVDTGANKLNVIDFRLNGVQKHLRVDDLHLAKAFQDLNRTQLDAFTRTFAVITRFYSGLATRFNPEFAVSNIIRDTQDLFVNMVGITGKTRSGVKSVGRVPKATKDILDWIRNKDSAGAKIYQQMRMDGGTTGGLSFTTREGIEKELDNIVKNGGKITHKSWKKLVKGIEDYNRVFEDATRLSAYKQALADGYTRKQSAVIAKNATVNFNTRGTASPWINAFYMFANASVQGSIRTIRSMKNPKVLGAMVGTVGAGIYWSHNHNDSIDPEWRDKIRKYDREHSFVILLPTEKTLNGELQYITIPVSWGIKPIKVLMERSYENMQGVGDTGEIVTDTARSFFEAYNPIGGSDFFSTIIPTPFDMPADIARNKAWHGGMIFPDWKEGLPAPEQVFSPPESVSEKSAVKISEMLDKVNIELSPEVLEYGFDQLVGGTGRATERTVNTVTGILSGNAGEIEKGDLVYINRFLKELKPTEVERRLEKQAEKELFDDLKNEKDLVERKDLVRDYVRSLEKEEAQSILFKLREKGFDTKGVSYSDNPRKPSSKDGTLEEWYAYYRSRKFNMTREEAMEMAEGWVGTVNNASGGDSNTDKLNSIFGDIGEKPKSKEDKNKQLENIFDFSQ